MKIWNAAVYLAGKRRVFMMTPFRSINVLRNGWLVTMGTEI